MTPFTGPLKVSLARTRRISRFTGGMANPADLVERSSPNSSLLSEGLTCAIVVSLLLDRAVVHELLGPLFGEPALLAADRRAGASLGADSRGGMADLVVAELTNRRP